LKRFSRAWKPAAYGHLQLYVFSITHSVSRTSEAGRSRQIAISARCQQTPAHMHPRYRRDRTVLQGLKQLLLIGLFVSCCQAHYLRGIRILFFHARTSSSNASGGSSHFWFMLNRGTDKQLSSCSLVSALWMCFQSRLLHNRRMAARTLSVSS